MTDGVMITGGAGYVGSHIAWALVEQGITPLLVDDFSADVGEAFDPTPPGCQVKCYDIGEGSDMLDLMGDNKIKTVIHCAAWTSAPESILRPFPYWENNVAKMINFLHVCKELEVSKFIFSSSAAVYTQHPLGRLLENEMLGPINPYGTTKQVGEMLLKESGIPYVILRYFNVAGADNSLRAGQLGEGTNLFRAILKAIREETAINIYGRTAPTRDGSTVRDYVHPTDIAYAHLHAVNHLHMGKGNTVWNVGTGVGHSTLEVIQMFEKIAGVTLVKHWQPAREGDPVAVVCDPTRITSQSKWIAKHSTLENMVRTALEFDQKVNNWEVRTD